MLARCLTVPQKRHRLPDSGLEGARSRTRPVGHSQKSSGHILLLRTSTLPGIAGVDHVLLGRNVPEAAVVVEVANFFRAILFAVIF